MSASVQLNRLPAEIRETILRHLHSRGYSRPISTAEAILATRKQIPSCRMSDAELTDIVARQAIDQGFDISFDGPAEK